MECVVLLNKENVKANISLRKALSEEKDEVFSLYKNAIGGKFCVWDENYPKMTDVLNDLETGNLYVLTQDGEIAGAVSVYSKNEMDTFDCWKRKDGKHKEIGRIVIAERYQGRGLAFEMVSRVTDLIRKDGYEFVRLSVAKVNIPAYKTYIKAGFTQLGEADMYGNSYYLMEKQINGREISNNY